MDHQNALSKSSNENLQQSIAASAQHAQRFDLAAAPAPALAPFPVSTHIMTQQPYYVTSPMQPMQYNYGFQPQPTPYHYGIPPQFNPNATFASLGMSAPAPTTQDHYGIPPQFNPNATYASLAMSAPAPTTQAFAAAMAAFSEPAPLPINQAYSNSSTVEHEERAIGSEKPRSRKSRVDFKSQWGKRYAQLVEFKRSHGHCNVPQRWAANLELGRWVKDQRTFKKKGKISQDRIEILEAIGFQWRLKSHVDFYNKQLSSLTEYKEAHGHCNVKMSNCDNVELVRWVDRKRRMWKEGKMSAERIQQLEEIGFQFD